MGEETNPLPEDPTPGRSVDPLSAEDEVRLGGMVLEAAGLPADERSRFLRRLSVAEPTLSAEVRRRLALAAELPETFLAVPAGELLEAAVEALDEEEGEAETWLTSADRYELGDCLGEGGMGRVHVAHDRQLRRSVALKLLIGTSPAATRRLLEEARSQAQIRHDYVLPVYDTGELNGRPYIAMQYVRGPSLLEIRRDLSSEECVRILAQAAEGLHEAHKVGLIHRDVKPANILVEASAGGRWRPWVADFGIAARQDAAEKELAGTPAYMAPELLAAEPAQADRRADVYSLGVTLYQLLSGELPRSGESLETFIHAAREEAEKPIRDRLPAISKELEAIVHQCLARDPAKRYSSARALAEDLWRYLDGEEVHAYSASLAERLSKGMVRHRALLSVAGVGLVLLLGALGVAAFLGIEARVANHRAELRRDQAEKLIGFMLDDLRAKLAAVGRLEILGDVGERALDYFAAVPEAELTDDELAFRSQALYQIGDVHLQRGQLEAAVKPLGESLALARALAAREPAHGERLFGLGQSHFWVGHVAWQRGKIEQARSSFEDYLEVSERLVEIDPGRLDWLLELSYSHSNLGFVDQAAGDLNGARKRFRDRLEIVEGLVSKEPGNLEWSAELAGAHNALGEVARRSGRLGQANLHFTHEHELVLRASELEPENRRWREYLGTSHHFVGLIHLYQGLTPKARDHFQASHRIFSELSLHDPENGFWRHQLAGRHYWLGEVEYSVGNFATARDQWGAALAIADELLRETPTHGEWQRRAGIYSCSHGRALASLGHLAAARQEAGRGIELLTAILATQPTDPKIIRWLSECHLLAGSLSGEGAAQGSGGRHFATALAAIEPVARNSTDGEQLATYAKALSAIGRLSDAREVERSLQRQGFVANGLRTASTVGPSEPIPP